MKANTCQEMHTIPEEGEGGGEEEEGGPDAAEVVEVLDGVHAEPGEGLDVRVAVVQGVDVLVHRLAGKGEAFINDVHTISGCKCNSAFFIQ